MAETLKDIAVIDLPYRRKATIKEVTFDSGMRLTRLILKEGMRITQVDLDDETAARLGRVLIDAAQGGQGG